MYNKHLLVYALAASVLVVGSSASGLLILGAGAAGAATGQPPAPPPAPSGPFPNATGQWSNFSNLAPQAGNPFSIALGTNGRTCASCHAPTDSWTATPAALQQRFKSTNGADPIFASVDGTNCPTLSQATPAGRQAASSLLLGKGLIRVAIAPPAQAQFKVSFVDNPYGCASASPVSVYRRILPTTNLAFLSDLMWDGRETLATTNIHAALLKQAADAVVDHAAGGVLPTATLQSMVSFETAQFSAQVSNTAAGVLNSAGASGGPALLAQQTFTPGANDPFGPSAPAPGVTPSPVFTVYSSWEALQGVSPAALVQASIGRGERIFNTRPMTIIGAAGLNDQANARGQTLTTVKGTCGSCHNAPNAGSSTTGRFFDTGVSHASNRTADLPLITLTNRTTGATIQTTDPGIALTTGLWADVNRFKVPTLRNLSARAPFFHNGSAQSLDAVVNFYNNRFNLNLTSQEHTDLVAFLSAL